MRSVPESHACKYALHWTCRRTTRSAPFISKLQTCSMPSHSDLLRPCSLAERGFFPLVYLMESVTMTPSVCTLASMDGLGACQSHGAFTISSLQQSSALAFGTDAKPVTGHAFIILPRERETRMSLSWQSGAKGGVFDTVPSYNTACLSY